MLNGNLFAKYFFINGRISLPHCPHRRLFHRHHPRPLPLVGHPNLLSNLKLVCPETFKISLIKMQQMLQIDMQIYWESPPTFK